MALTTINAAKELAASYQPLLLAVFTFPDDSVLRLSTHPLNVTEGGAQYGGVDYLARLASQDIAQIQSLSETGADLIPTVRLNVADPDAYIHANYERAAGKGFRGARLELRLIFADVAAWTFSSDSRIIFLGECEKPSLDAKGMVIQATAKTALTRALLPSVPCQARCPWRNPTTTAQRAEAANADSTYYQCGETRSTGTAPPCSYTKATCTQEHRFGGITYTPPAGMRVREYTSGKWDDVKGDPNLAKYGSHYPLVLGTAWVKPLVMNVIPDGNYVRCECVVAGHEVSSIGRVLLNGYELGQTSATITGSRDFRWHWINQGGRDGAHNTDVPYSGAGDPYGGLAAIQVLAPRAVVGDGAPDVRVLVTGPKVRAYKTVASASGSGGVITVTLSGANEDIADGTTVTITGCSWAAVNGTWPAINGTWGPPGTFQLQGSSGTGSGTGGMVSYETGYSATFENPVWVLATILQRAGYPAADIDLTSFATAAAKLSGVSAAIVLQDRRSAQEIIRGLRQAFGLVLSQDQSTGLLRCVLRSTLADEQGATISGSNYDTAITSKLRNGTTANGYVAYSFDSSSILADSQPTTLEELPRAAGDVPNKVTVQFQDRTCDYSPSALTLLDSDDLARLDGREQAGSLSVAPEGLTSQADALRAARVALAEILKGNESGDTRGTRWFRWKTTCKGLHLRVGHIVRLSDTRLGLTNQLVRIQQIQPSQNYETVTITASWHSDDWYTDAFAAGGAQATTARRRDSLERGPFQWMPDSAAPPAGDSLYGTTDKTFSLVDSYSTATDGSERALLTIGGSLPINTFSAVPPPSVPLQASTATTGGSIAGARSLYLCVCSKDSGGLYSTPSATIAVTTAAGTNTNTVTVASLVWPTGATGYAIFCGSDPQTMTCCGTGGTTPSSITLTSLNEDSWGVPDVEFDALVALVKRVTIPGARKYVSTGLGATTVTVASAGWTVNEWAGRIVSFLGIGICNVTVSSNTSDTLTFSGPSPLAQGYAVGAGFVIRAKVTAAGATLSDSKWGLTASAHVGKLARIIAGTGRGVLARITANTTTSITLACADSFGSDTVPIIEEEASLYYSESSGFANSDYAGAFSLNVEVANVAQECLLVEMWARDGGGKWSARSISREILLDGQVGSAGGYTPPDPPNAPTSPTISISASGVDDYYANISWTAPSPIGTTIAYRPVLKFWDAATNGNLLHTVPTGDTALTSLSIGPAPRDPTATVYAELTVYGLNSDGAQSSAATSSRAAITPLGSLAAPPVPTSVAVSIALPDTSKYTITLTWSAPSDVTNVTGYDVELSFYDPVSHASVGDWGWTSPVAGAGTGSATQTYVHGTYDRQQDDWDIKARVRSRNGDQYSAWVASTAFVLIARLAAAPTPTGCTLTVQTSTIDGVPHYRCHVVSSIPADAGTGTAIRYEVRTYSNAAGGDAYKNREWGCFSGDVPLTMTTVDSDWWKQAGVAEWAQVRCGLVDSNGNVGTWYESAVVPIGASPGLDITAAKATYTTAEAKLRYGYLEVQGLSGKSDYYTQFHEGGMNATMPSAGCYVTAIETATSAQVNIKGPTATSGMASIGMYSDTSSNRITSTRNGAYIEFTGLSAYINFSGTGSYLNIGEIQIGGNQVVSSARNATFNSLTLTNDLAVAHGGTGASDAAGARSNLGAAPATSGTSILKGNGSGGFSSASSGTDYAPATSGTSILKGNGSGGFSNASAGTDYAAVSHTHSAYSKWYGYATSDPAASMSDDDFATWWDSSTLWLVYKKGGNKFRVAMASY